MEDKIHEWKLGKWVSYNAKQLSFGGFEVDVGMRPDEFFALHKTECFKMWREFVGMQKKEVSEAAKKSKQEKNERITAYRLEYKQSKPKAVNVPIAIKQLAELHVMVSLGEYSAENFCKAFYARFPAEVQRVKNKRSKESNYGWDQIDWDKVETHPLLSQLLV